MLRCAGGLLGYTRCLFTTMMIRTTVNGCPYWLCTVAVAKQQQNITLHIIPHRLQQYRKVIF
jgi:hypothetical protein